jgi:hypothetical protein
MIVDECGADGGMKIHKGDGGTRRKSSPIPICPP